MEYLCDVGVSPQAIKVLTESNDEQVVCYLEDNEAKVKDIISYLNRVGIREIESLLIYKPYLFYETLETVMEVFSKPNAVMMVNENVDELDELFN